MQKIKKLATGGALPEPQEVDQQGLQDVSVPDALAIYGLGSGLGALKDLGEAGILRLGEKMVSDPDEIESELNNLGSKLHPGDKVPTGSGNLIYNGKQVGFEDIPDQHLFTAEGVPGLQEGSTFTPSTIGKTLGKASKLSSGGVVNNIQKPKTGIEPIKLKSPASGISGEGVSSLNKGGPVMSNEDKQKKVMEFLKAQKLAKGGKVPLDLDLKKGALHKEMGISEDKNIPVKALDKAANSDNETLRKRAQFAINAKKWHKAADGVQTPDTEDDSDSDDEGPNGIPTPGNDVDQPSKLQQILNYIKGVASSPAATVGSDTAALVGGNPTPAIQDLGSQIPNSVAQPAINAGIKGINAATNLNIPQIPNNANTTTSQNAPPAGVTAATGSTTPAVPVQAPTNPNGVDPTAALRGADVNPPTLNPADRTALANKLIANQHNFGSYLGEALAGVGDALAARGGRNQNSLNDIFTMQKQQRDDALNNYDKAQQIAVENFQMKNQALQSQIDKIKTIDQYGFVPDAIAQQAGYAPGSKVTPQQIDLALKQQGIKLQIQQHEEDLTNKAATQASDDYEKNKTSYANFVHTPQDQAKIIANLTSDNLAQYHGLAKIIKPGHTPQYVSPAVAQAAMAQDPKIQRIF